MAEAVERINSHSSLAYGGITLYRRPMAFSLALRKRIEASGTPNDLTLINFTSSLESDLLLASDAISKIRTCYFGLEVFGLAPHFTTAAAKGSIQIIEETEASLAFGFRATMADVGFMPSFAWQGTDLLDLRPDVQTIQDPYSGEELTAFPAIEVDLAVIHAIKADPQGNAVIGKNRGVDRELPLVANQVIVTAEEIVASLDEADILGPMVDCVVHAPQGAWPTSCHPCYPLDGFAILEYLEKAGTEQFHELMTQWTERLTDGRSG